MIVLGIETSCDETAAAVLDGGRKILSSVVASQDDVHAPYGGVVPELASRRHLEVVVPVIRRALGDSGMSLRDLDGIAVTQGPGLVGSLLVGVQAAKARAWATRETMPPGRPSTRSPSCWAWATRAAPPSSGLRWAAMPLPSACRRRRCATARPTSRSAGSRPRCRFTC